MADAEQQYGIQDRLEGYTAQFKEMIASWDKIQFAASPAQTVPQIVIDATGEVLEPAKAAGASFVTAGVAAKATGCVNILAQTMRTPTAIDNFKDCLRAATR